MDESSGSLLTNHGKLSIRMGVASDDSVDEDMSDNSSADEADSIKYNANLDLTGEDI